MNQIDEVIAPAADDEQPVSNVLRKCLILAFELKNEKLKTWVEKELNGFESKDDVPEYRKISLHSKGNFQGPGGAWIPSRPLPMGILSKKHRDFLVPTLLTQPIAAYEVDPEQIQKGAPVINWPPDLIVMYQSNFIPGYAPSIVGRLALHPDEIIPLPVISHQPVQKAVGSIGSH